MIGGVVIALVGLSIVLGLKGIRDAIETKSCSPKIPEIPKDALK